MIMTKRKSSAKKSKAAKRKPQPVDIRIPGDPPKTAVKSEVNSKQPVDRRESPLARDPRGSATRQEIRKISPMVNAPRATRRPTERSGQKRTH